MLKLVSKNPNFELFSVVITCWRGKCQRYYNTWKGVMMHQFCNATDTDLPALLGKKCIDFTFCKRLPSFHSSLQFVHELPQFMNKLKRRQIRVTMSTKNKTTINNKVGFVLPLLWQPHLAHEHFSYLRFKMRMLHSSGLYQGRRGFQHDDACAVICIPSSSA